VLKIKPDNAEAHNALGILLYEQGRLEEAATSCRQALHVNPNLAVAHSSLGGILHKLGHLDEACKSYLMALQLSPIWWKPTVILAWPCKK